MRRPAYSRAAVFAPVVAADQRQQPGPYSNLAAVDRQRCRHNSPFSHCDRIVATREMRKLMPFFSASSCRRRRAIRVRGRLAVCAPRRPRCAARNAALRVTAVHKTGHFAELVCSNSFRPMTPKAARSVSCMRRCAWLGSLVMRAADAHKLPAGSALAVDRDGFAAAMTAALEASRSSRFDREEVRRATGGMGQRHHRHRPADLAGLADTIRRLTGEDALHSSTPLRRLSREFDRLRHRVVSVALRQGRPAARAPITSTVHLRARNTSLYRRFWPAKSCVSRFREKRRPISTAACRWK